MNAFLLMREGGTSAYIGLLQAYCLILCACCSTSLLIWRWTGFGAIVPEEAVSILGNLCL